MIQTVDHLRYVSGCCGNYTPLIHPDNHRLLLWIMCGAFLIAYDVLMMPYRFCFEAPALGIMFVFENFVTVYFKTGQYLGDPLSHPIYPIR